MKTLLLNSDGNVVSIVPLSVISWQDSIKLLVLDKITPIVDYDDIIIHSPSTSITLPAVAMLKRYFPTNRGPVFSKTNILLRDYYCCGYCGHSFYKSHNQLTLDHVIPKAKGGKKSWNNIVSCCYSCNIKKGDRYQKPILPPYKPSIHELNRNRKMFPIKIKHYSWQEYLQWDNDLIDYNDCEDNEYYNIKELENMHGS